MASATLDLGHTFGAGAVATATLAALMYGAPLAGLPRLDMASAIGGFAGRPAETFSIGWWAGLTVFLLAGIVFSPIIFRWMEPFLYGASAVRGMEWGVLLWAFGGVCVMVHLGLSFHEPFTSHPHWAALGSLLGHIIYGGVLGALMPLAAAGGAAAAKTKVAPA